MKQINIWLMVAENIPKLGIYIKLQILEALQTLRRINTMRSIPEHIKIKLLDQ